MDLDDPDYWKSLINMSLSRFVILRTLHDNPTHGYAILENLREFTKGCCAPAYGTIYPILKELQIGKYATVKMEADGNRLRKVYELTPKGELAYQQAINTWKEVLPIIEKIVLEQKKDNHD